MTVCGNRRHQNWGIGPSLGSRERTVEILKRTEVIVEIWNIFANILILIHSCWKLNWYEQLLYIKVHGETSYLKIDWYYTEELRDLLSYSYWQWLSLNLDTVLIVYIWLDWYHDSIFIYIIVGEWYRSHIRGRSPCLRYTSYTKRVQSTEKQVWLLLPTTPGLIDYCIVVEV